MKKKSSNDISSVLGFRQCLEGCLYENLDIFQTFGQGAFWGNIPKLLGVEEF